MTEKPAENQPHIESQSVPNQGAEFLEFQQWKAQKQHEQREEARKHFPERPSEEKAKEVAKILKFPSGEPMAAPTSSEAELADMNPKDRELLDTKPIQWLRNSIGKKLDDPHTAIEGLAEAQRIKAEAERIKNEKSPLDLAA